MVGCMTMSPSLAPQPRRYRLSVVACSPRHFARPSLYARGLADPADVLQQCLVAFRRARVPDLVPLLACPPEPSPCYVAVGGQQVQERGPLAPLTGVLDAGARRVLPGHLLRRSRVLSTLRLGTSFQQRIALTACTGEESVFEWSLQQFPSSSNSSSSSGISSNSSSTGGSSSEEEETGGEAAASSSLQQQQQLSSLAAAAGQLPTQQQLLLRQSTGQGGEGPAMSASSSNGGSSGSGSGSGEWDGGMRWVVASVRRDSSSDEPLPTTPHPKVAPESVVEAQLAALRRGDVFGASCFNIWRTHSSGFGLGIHYELMRDKLAQAPYDVLLHHGEAYLGEAALPSQRVMLQEVVVLGGGPQGGGGGGGRGGSSGVRFLWRLGMQANGCWMVTGISVVDTY